MNKPTVLILGGRDKGESYEELFTMLKDSNIVATVICGENSTSMLKTAVLCGLKNVSVVDDFDKAVSLAEFLTPLGGNVLLSPASSSFDRFSGYAERGEYFCKVVKGFEEKPTFDL
jgi:UDP-N-acetylmuramoylalanine--D-glutamate ligase